MVRRIFDPIWTHFIVNLFEVDSDQIYLSLETWNVYGTERHSLTYAEFEFSTLAATAIHRINHYPADSVIDFRWIALSNV